MSLVVASAREGDSLRKEHVDVPPLFAGPVRDDLAARICAAISAGDHEKAAVLLHEADREFAGDPTFCALQAECLKLARRKAYFEAALAEASNALSEDRFTESFGKFREALCLGRGYSLFEERTSESFITAAYTVLSTHWRFAESLLLELASVAGQSAVPTAILDSIARQNREDCIRTALEESDRLESAGFLPHLRRRLARLASANPDSEELESRLRSVDGLMEQQFAEEREKNLRRLTLFRDRLDLTENPQILSQCRELVAGFVEPYSNDPAFLSVLEDMRSLHLSYENAARLLTENRWKDALQLCDQVLQQRPANVLFARLEEKAKAREWVSRLVIAYTQRAQTFEQKAQYAEALDEWQSVHEIDPNYPGLTSEMFHCAALKHHSENSGWPLQSSIVDVEALTPEVVGCEPEYEHAYDPPPIFASHSYSDPLPLGLRIAITQEAWNHLKTGLAAAFALLLVVLVFASNSRR